MKPTAPLETARQASIEIVMRLGQAGYQACWAGGCVRDQLMGRTPHDYDVATEATPQQVLEIFPKSQKVGAAFGVILVRLQGQSIEVATFRTEGGYQDGRHPTQVQFATAQEDAQRRDFTCNGLFMDPLERRIIDYVGGQKDIENQCLRAIGEPSHRFGEDHLRLLRAIRFAAKLEFRIEPRTWQAIGELAPNIRTISRERIGDEMRAMLTHPTRPTAAELLWESGLLTQLWPPEYLHPPTAWEHLRALPESTLPEQAFYALQRDLTAPDAPEPRWELLSERLREILAWSNQETVDFLWYAQKLQLLGEGQNLSMAAFKRLLADPRWPRLERLWRAVHRETGLQERFTARVAALRQDPIGAAPLVSGRDLIELGATPGADFKRWLEELYDRQLENEFPDRPAALQAAKRLVSGS